MPSSVAERLASLETRVEMAYASHESMQNTVEGLRQDITTLISSMSRLEATVQAHLKANNGRHNPLVDRGLAAGGGGGAIAAVVLLGKVIGWW